MNLYLTADKPGIQTGGGVVTANELAALRMMGETKVVSRDELEAASAHDVARTAPPDPWQWDWYARHMFGNSIKFCHGYAGSFGESVKTLKRNGAKVTWTVAAHCVYKSRKAHEDLDLSFPYTHLTDPELFKRYTEGYRLADVLIAPGKAPMETLRRQGMTQRIEIIPHGADRPKCKNCGGSGGSGPQGHEICHVCDDTGIAPIAPFPKHFTVGYMGACGAADKGVRYLLEAWKKLNYPDAVLVLTGKDSQSDWVEHLCRTYGGGTIVRTGWVENVSDFYNSLSLYVQPSVTEGFGIEVLEAMAHGRPVLCSDGAGAADLVPNPHTFPSGRVDILCDLIDQLKGRGDLIGWGKANRQRAEEHSWDKIRQRYIDLWQGLLK